MNTEIMKELREAGFIDTKCMQTADNCFEIACYLAKKFGFSPPLSDKELADKITKMKDIHLWGQPGEYQRIIQKSLALFIIYEKGFFPMKVHVVFQFSDEQYNFGPDEEEGFEIGVRIPLTPQAEKGGE